MVTCRCGQDVRRDELVEVVEWVGSKWEWNKVCAECAKEEEMSIPEWPIRIGGKYPANGREWTQYAEVIDINGDHVYFERKRMDGTEHTFPTGDMPEGAFRNCYQPEVAA